MAKKYIKIPVLLLLFSAVSLITWAITRGSVFRSNKPKNTVAKIVKRKEIAIDTVVLSRAKRALIALDLDRKECLVAGIINSVNRADKDDLIKDVPYLYSKNGDDFYYRLGETETVNANGLYIYIDHGGKKILVSDQRKISDGPQQSNLAGMLDELVVDEYKVNCRKQGSIQVLNLLNENDLNIKEYTLHFDTLSLKPQKVHIRIANPDDPTGTNNEQIMDVRFTELSNHSEIERYIGRHIVRKEGTHFRPVGEFKAYELIEL